MSTAREPGRPVPRDDAFRRIVGDLQAAADPAKVRDVLRGPLHLTPPLRLGDVIFNVVASDDDPQRLNVTLQNALTLNPPIVIWTVP